MSFQKISDGFPGRIFIVKAVIGGQFLYGEEKRHDKKRKKERKRERKKERKKQRKNK